MATASRFGNVNGQPGREELIVEAALELPTEACRVFLEQACGDDSELRQLVEGLLQVHYRIGSLHPSAPLRAGAAASVPTAYVAEKPGDRIGRYKLLEQIGEGGCGIVYRTMQQEPVRRLVALKVIKPGMDSRKVLARFEAERQVLALMDHPNIAKVLDAGATDTGRPYFVMELVRGIPITSYCDHNQLSTEVRLNIFIQVCQAVQHAHQKGIIHRDIKPSNILVAYHDGLAIPKVIDFGIAKATTEQPLTNKTLFTAFEQFIGTPAYMSPEQAKPSGVDIDTRSDIYTLGVLLYELLTGQTPFETDRLVKAGLDEIRRIVREEEPPRPSTRLHGLDPATRTTIARRRQAEPHRLVQRIRGDLDWIVMKCLEKDRLRRYATASGLARDIERHLNNEPVVARPPSRLYEFHKTVRRHKFGFLAATLVMVALVAGVVASSLEALRARRAENLANQRLTESEAISKFLVSVFETPDPGLKGVNRNITVADSLDVAARKVETNSTIMPAARARLLFTLGLTYYGLGLDQKAIPLQETVRDYYLHTAGLENHHTLLAMHNLANTYDRVGRRQEALKLREQVLALRRKVNGPEQLDTLAAMNSLAISYVGLNRLNEAAELLTDTLALYRKVYGPEHLNTLNALNNLGGLLAYAGETEKALGLLQEALTLGKKIDGPTHPETLRVMRNLAYCYDRLGRPADALKMTEEYVAVFREVRGLKHPETLGAIFSLAQRYRDVRRLEQAISLGEELLPLSREVSGPRHSETQNAIDLLAGCYFSVGRNREGLALIQELSRLDPTNSYQSLRLGAYQAWCGQDAEYQSTRRRLVELAVMCEDYGWAERAAKVYCLQTSADLTTLRQVLDLARKSVSIDNTNPWVHLALGMAQYRNGLYGAAEQTLMITEQMAGVCSETTGTARLFRALCVSRQGRPGEAQGLFRQAEAEMPPFPKDESKPFADINPSHDLLIWWLAYKEAKAELHEPTDSRAASL